MDRVNSLAELDLDEESAVKKIAIFFPGSDDQQQVEDRRLLPGTSALDLLRSLGLTGYALRKPDDSGFFAATDDIYAALERSETSKLEAIPGMTVAQVEAPTGASVRLPRLVRSLGELIVGPRAVPVVTPTSARASSPADHAPVVQRTVARDVERQPVLHWQRQGWRQIDERTWRGSYRLPQGTWTGEIEKIGARLYRPWLTVIPPVEVRAHPHAVCLFYKGSDRYMLHFSRDPTSVDAAITAMTEFLADSFAAARRKVAA